MIIIVRLDISNLLDHNYDREDNTMIKKINNYDQEDYYNQDE